MQCQLEVPAISGLKDNELSVGREALLHCKGEWPQKLDLENLSVQTVPETPHVFKILNLERRDLNSADIQWTSYLVGNHKLSSVLITDGQEKVDLGPFEYQVVSIIDSAEPPKQPYGPAGPLTLGTPVIIWMTLIIVVLAITGIVSSIILKRNRQRRWNQERVNYQTRMSPIMQLYVDVRKAEKQWGNFTDHDKNTKLLHLFDEYLIRTFDWPIPHLSRLQVNRLIKKEFPKDKALALQIIGLQKNIIQLCQKVNTDETYQILLKDIQTLFERVEREKQKGLNS